MLRRSGSVYRLPGGSAWCVMQATSRIASPSLSMLSECDERQPRPTPERGLS